MFQMNDPDIPRGDRTYRLLCRYFRVDHEKLKGEWLQDFKVSHHEWLQKVSESFLRKSKPHQTLDRYLKYLPVEAFPLDTLAILIYARMCHEHVAVFVGERYWTTHVDDDFQKCKVFLAYHGELVFDDSRMMTGPEYGLVREDVMRLRRHLEREAAKIYAEEKAAAEHEGRDIKKKNTNYIDSDSEESDLENLLEETSPEDNETVQTKDMDENMANDCAKNREASDIMQNQSVETDNGANKENASDIMQNQNEASDIKQQQNDAEDNGEKEEASDIMQKENDAEDIMQKEEESDANYLRQIEKQQRANKRKHRSSKKKSKKKKLEVPPSSRVLCSRNKDPVAPKKYSDVIMDSIEKAKSGSLNISSFRLRRRTRHERKFVCTCCKDKFDSTSELTKHLKAKHPDYKYSCKKCTKTFATNWTIQTSSPA